MNRLNKDVIYAALEVHGDMDIHTISCLIEPGLDPEERKRHEQRVRVHVSKMGQQERIYPVAYANLNGRLVWSIHEPEKPLRYVIPIKFDDELSGHILNTLRRSKLGCSYGELLDGAFGERVKITNDMMYDFKRTLNNMKKEGLIYMAEPGTYTNKRCWRLKE